MRTLFLIALLLCPPIVAAAQDAPVDMSQDMPVVDAPTEVAMPDTSAVTVTDGANPIVPVDPYTISNVVVDVTADNAVKARDEAFKKGAEEAVKQFLAAQGAPEELNGIDPNALVRDFQVNEEHFSRTRYKAVLTYRFKPSAMGRIVNAAVPVENALPVPEEDAVHAAVPEEAVETRAPAAPVDYDQPWSPTTAGQRSAPPPADVPAAPLQAAPRMNTWTLTVSYDEVAQWLAAQNLIVARPEIRGLKMDSMGGNQARLTITTEESADSVRAKWQSIGWPVSGGGESLGLDARGMGH